MIEPASMADILQISTGMPWNPDDEEMRGIAKWADDQRSKAREKRSAFYKQATMGWRYFLYAEGKVDRSNPFDSLVKTNPLRDTIEKMVAVATDSRPNLTVLPRQPEDMYLSLAMGDVVNWIWEVQGMDQLVEDYIRELLVCGLSWMYVGWSGSNQDVDLWKPDVRDVTWDPEARVLSKRRWVGVESYLPRSVAIEMWPEAADAILEMPSERPEDSRSGINFDQDFSEKGSAPITMPSDWAQADRYAGSGKTATRAMDRKGVKPPDTDDTIHYFEMYVRPSKGEWGMGPGRKICVLGHQVIPPGGDIESPFDDVDRHPDPFVEVSMDEVPGEAGPQGIAKQGIPLQKQRAELIRDICNHAKRESTSRIFFNKAYIKQEAIESGKAWIPTDVDGLDDAWVKPVQAAQLSDAVIKAYEIVVSEFDVTMGIHDPDRGEVTGETAGVVLKEAKKVFQQGVRLRVRSAERALDQIGNRICSRVRQFYTYPKTIRVLGQQGMAFLQLQPVTMDAMGQPASMSPFALANDEFDFKVKTGSSMPPDIEKTIQIGMVMAQSGWISPQQVVSYTPFKADGPMFAAPQGAPPGGAPLNQGQGPNATPPGSAPAGAPPMSGAAEQTPPSQPMMMAGQE